MRSFNSAYFFSLGLAAGALDASGYIRARNVLAMAGRRARGRFSDGFDCFYDAASLFTGIGTRFKAAIAAFRAARCSPYYAVIYDSAEGIDLDKEERREEYYESFGSPEQAAEIFRVAFPHGRIAKDGFDMADRPRLVMILGSIDNYSTNKLEI